MSEKIALPITAHVSSAEQRIMVAAAKRLARCVREAGATDTMVTLSFDAAEARSAAQRGLMLLSPMAEIAGTDPIASIEARWLELLDQHSSAGFHSLFLCTLFRHVAAERDRAPLMERIRRLNLLMIRLSHASGAAVIDLDRVLTLFGARALSTDYSLSGRLAPQLAAFAVVSAFFEEGLTPWLPPDIEKRARDVHGGEAGMVAYLESVKLMQARRADPPR